MSSAHKISKKYCLNIKIAAASTCLLFGYPYLTDEEINLSVQLVWFPPATNNLQNLRPKNLYSLLQGTLNSKSHPGGKTGKRLYIPFLLYLQAIKLTKHNCNYR